MYYERKIKYLDYLVKQEKCGNAGFMKLEVRGDICNITINVTNLRPEDSLPVKVYLVGDGYESELCVLDLVRGKGMKQLLRQAVDNLGNTGISYDALEAVRMPISTEREVYGVIGQAAKVNEVYAATEPEAIVAECEVSLEVEKEAKRENLCIKEEENIAEPQTTVQEEPDANSLREKVKVPLYDDKWKQLWEIYPHIIPFRDGREYLSIGPNDFVILPGKYFRMANNSFLLHGYYNYRHLILKKMEHHGETRYYIGVPGNFYDREKQVAVMFGFESFESLEESAQVGDYGYYLMRIEL